MPQHASPLPNKKKNLTKYLSKKKSRSWQMKVFVVRAIFVGSLPCSNANKPSYVHVQDICFSFFLPCWIFFTRRDIHKNGHIPRAMHTHIFLNYITLLHRRCSNSSTSTTVAASFSSQQGCLLRCGNLSSFFQILFVRLSHLP